MLRLFFAPFCAVESRAAFERLHSKKQFSHAKGRGGVHQNFAVFVLSAELQYATDPLIQMPLQNKCRLFQLPSVA